MSQGGEGESQRIERVDTSGRSLPPIYQRVATTSAKKTRRSDAIWLALMGAVVAGPLLYQAMAADVRRNLYATREDCVADYSEAECPRVISTHPYSPDPRERKTLRYHGPWYRDGSTARTSSDPGPGRTFERSNSSDTPGSRSAAAPTGTEPGVLRGGFGRTGSVRLGRGFGG